jgi:hypothetical protein
MPHPLVLQLRFTRSEFRRALQDVTEDEGQRRFEPMNSISWIVGHLAWQEQLYWLTRAQGKVVLPDLNETNAFGKPASNPPLNEMWQAWRTITEAADPWLDTLKTDTLTSYMTVNGKPHWESIGSMLRRVVYHYWYHTGESQAIRQLLGHKDLPTFVGNIHHEAPYIPESD